MSHVYRIAKAEMVVRLFNFCIGVLSVLAAFFTAQHGDILYFCIAEFGALTNLYVAFKR